MCSPGAGVDYTPEYVTPVHHFICRLLTSHPMESSSKFDGQQEIKPRHIFITR